jgi:hypothetical protein
VPYACTGVFWFRTQTDVPGDPTHISRGFLRAFQKIFGTIASFQILSGSSFFSHPVI